MLTSDPKMPHLHHCGYNMNFHKNQNRLFKPLCNDHHQIQFQKNQMNRLGRKVGSIDFRLKNDPFVPIFNVCHQVQFQKNLMTRF